MIVCTDLFTYVLCRQRMAGYGWQNGEQRPDGLAHVELARSQLRTRRVQRITGFTAGYGSLGTRHRARPASGMQHGHTRHPMQRGLSNGPMALLINGSMALHNNRMQQTAPLGGRASNGSMDAAASCAPFGAHRRRC